PRSRQWQALACNAGNLLFTGAGRRKRRWFFRLQTRWLPDQWLRSGREIIAASGYGRARLYCTSGHHLTWTSSYIFVRRRQTLRPDKENCAAAWRYGGIWWKIKAVFSRHCTTAARKAPRAWRAPCQPDVP